MHIVAPGRLPLFDALTPDEVHLLLPHMTTHLAPRGSTIVSRGALESPLILVRKGRINVACDGASRPVAQVTREAPCLAGEADVLSRGGALLGLRAETSLVYFSLPAAALREVVQLHPALGARLLTALVAGAHQLAEALELCCGRVPGTLRRPGAAAVRRSAPRNVKPRATRSRLAKARGEIV